MSITALAGSVSSEFSCIGDNGTMTHYSYFKEPGLDESSYTRGYKTGSINYLANGNIDFQDYFGYYDGQIDEAHSDPFEYHNSTVYHYQIVNFTGEKGISEIYAKGFYPNNRAVSAWKKIRYDDLEYVKYGGVLHLSGAPRIQGIGRSPIYSGTYNLGESHKSSHINVEAYADMGNTEAMGVPIGSGSRHDYEFKYNANVKDGIIEIRDATGWTNKTAYRRIDWEQDALIRGDNISIVNNLIAENMSYPAAGLDEDWLSCCIGGQPDFEQDSKRINMPNAGFHCDEDDECYIDGSKWPNEGIYATLRPNPILPNLKRSPECIIDPITGILRCTEPPVYDDFNCTNTSCPGFECIFQFRPTEPTEESEDNGEKETEEASAGVAGNVTSDPYVILTHELDEDKFEEDGTAPYIITITSRLNLSDVTLYDEYPSDFGYKGSSKDPKTTFNNTVIWDNLTLVAGQRTPIEVYFTYDVNTPAEKLPGRLIDFNAYATWDNGTRRSANTTVSVLGV